MKRLKPGSLVTCTLYPNDIGFVLTAEPNTGTYEVVMSHRGVSLTRTIQARHWWSRLIVLQKCPNMRGRLS